MDEIYTTQEEQIMKPNQLDVEISNIMRQALDPTCKFMNRPVPDSHDVFFADLMN
jgi:hypothetical protein